MSKIIPPDGATSLHFPKTVTHLKGHFTVSSNYLLLILFKVAGHLLAKTLWCNRDFIIGHLSMEVGQPVSTHREA